MAVKLCPVCGVELKPRMVYEIEIDFCPKCGGVWLDGGELNKLIAKVREYEAEYRGDTQYKAFEEEYVKKRKKRSFFEFIEDIFEFGD
ncbi:MAG: zf-TFIIB domain-containing protein [Desulfurococcales archaeon]|nr:zf-TFIIB domain-containing protein [Desulfurococcales archaeon]